MLKKYDLVRVSRYRYDTTEAMPEEVLKQFVGALGIVTNVYKGELHPYELIYVGKHHNKLSKKVGGMLWSEEELTAI